MPGHVYDVIWPITRRSLQGELRFVKTKFQTKIYSMWASTRLLTRYELCVRCTEILRNLGSKASRPRAPPRIQPTLTTRHMRSQGLWDPPKKRTLVSSGCTTELTVEDGPLAWPCCSGCYWWSSGSVVLEQKEEETRGCVFELRGLFEISCIYCQLCLLKRLVQLALVEIGRWLMTKVILCLPLRFMENILSSTLASLFAPTCVQRS